MDGKLPICAQVPLGSGRTVTDPAKAVLRLAMIIKGWRDGDPERHSEKTLWPLAMKARMRDLELLAEWYHQLGQKEA